MVIILPEMNAVDHLLSDKMASSTQKRSVCSMTVGLSVLMLEGTMLKK